uniref:DUF7054 domain-containing protein n=1 Tax=Kalanchoe fedtschenkoi TaxID=63787 RepID=A0A7N0V3W9_KALFE
MTERLSLRRRVHSSNDRRRKQRPPHQSPSITRSSPRSRRSGERSIEPVKSLKRCASAPAICGAVGSGEERSNLYCNEGVLPRGRTSWDVLSASAPSRAQSFRFAEEERGYIKEAKVVVNVTVEGSVGPIRTMVRLGSSVEDTIKLTLEKYAKEGRRSMLCNEDGVSFDLHDSYFSLQCLGKSELIGDIGSRSFYLRASRKGGNSPVNAQPQLGAASVSAPVLLTEPLATGAATGPAQHSALLFLPGFISRRISKLVRRTRKLWKILGCLQSSG